MKFTDTVVGKVANVNKNTNIAKMKTHVSILPISIGIFLFPSLVQGGCEGNVGRCDWTPWSGWSQCSRECAGGNQRRDRKFCCKLDLVNDIERCMQDCGMDYNVHRSGFYDRKDCNEFCFNGGTYMFYSYCKCSDRYKGTCCRDGESSFRYSFKDAVSCEK